MPSNPLILCHPCLLPSILPSIRFFSSESTLRIRWPKYWSFTSSISPSNECAGLISFKIDWFDPLAVQRALKSPLQHHSWKASILPCSTFFMVQFLHPYTATGKTIALTVWTFADKVMSLLFHTMHRGLVFPSDSDSKESACNSGDLGSVPGLGRSPREGNGNQLQYSCLENPVHEGAWRAPIHGIAKS